MFVRPLRLVHESVVKDGAVFLRDIQWDAYCLRPWQLIGPGIRPTIVEGIMALVCWDKGAVDWDYLEWFLGQNKFHRIPEWVLPTAQAGLATRCKAKFDTFSSPTYANALERDLWCASARFLSE